MTPAPIALFVYKRPDHVRATIDALSRNELAPDSDLYVFSDGPKSPADAPRVDAVREYLASVTGFRSVVRIDRSVNLGLAESIIAGVTDLCRSHGRVIVVEDDLETSPFFLRYMNDALAMYEDTPDVVSIHGYVYPTTRPLPDTFFLRGADCWGWATWQRGWDVFVRDGQRLLADLESRGLTRAFDLDDTAGYTQMLKAQIAGRNDSWAVRWYASAFLAGKLTLYPGRSLVRNIGLDGSGTHCNDQTTFDVSPVSRPLRLEKLEPREHAGARAAVVEFFRHAGAEAPSLGVRVLRRLVALVRPA